MEFAAGGDLSLEMEGAIKHQRQALEKMRTRAYSERGIARFGPRLHRQPKLTLGPPICESDVRHYFQQLFVQFLFLL